MKRRVKLRWGGEKRWTENNTNSRKWENKREWRGGEGDDRRRGRWDREAEEQESREKKRRRTWQTDRQRDGGKNGFTPIRARRVLSVALCCTEGMFKTNRWEEDCGAVFWITKLLCAAQVSSERRGYLKIWHLETTQTSIPFVTLDTFTAESWMLVIVIKISQKAPDKHGRCCSHHTDQRHRLSDSPDKPRPPPSGPL